MKPISKIILLIFVSTLFSCNNQSERSKETDKLEPAMSMDVSAIRADVAFEESGYEEKMLFKAKGRMPSERQPHTKNKIIKDGSISVKANKIVTSKGAVDVALKKFNAYYQTEEFKNNDKVIAYNLKIRIPSDKFEQLIASIENGPDEIVDKSVEARDVTEEYIDIETRLANKREYLKRYKQLLSKALTVKDILEIEENVRNIEEEIESREGRLKFLNDQIAYSTLDIYLFKDKDVSNATSQQAKFSERVKKSLVSGWTSVVDFVLWSIKVWPYIIIVTVLVMLLRRIIKKRRSK
jgi:hypothetical protein